MTAELIIGPSTAQANGPLPALRRMGLEDTSTIPGAGSRRNGAALGSTRADCNAHPFAMPWNVPRAVSRFATTLTKRRHVPACLPMPRLSARAGTRHVQRQADLGSDRDRRAERHGEAPSRRRSRFAARLWRFQRRADDGPQRRGDERHDLVSVLRLQAHVDPAERRRHYWG